MFILVGLFFWKHFEGNLDRFGRQSVIQDQAQALTEQQAELILQFAESLKSTYGLELEVTIGPDADRPAPEDAKTLSIALDPGKRLVRIHYPPLLRTALPQELQESLQGRHFEPFFDQGQPGQGLLLGLTRIWEELISLDTTQQQGRTQ